MKRRIVALILIHLILVSAVYMSGLPMSASKVHAVGKEDTGTEKSGSNDDVLDALFGGGKKDNEDQPSSSGHKQGEDQQQEEVVAQVGEADYFDVLKQWEKEGIRTVSGFEQAVEPANFSAQGSPVTLQPASDSQGYGSPVFRWDEKTPSVSFHVQVPQDGLYAVRVDYYPLSEKVISIERGIQINGKYPYFQSRQFELPKYWKDDRYPFDQDLLGNDVLPDQQMIPGWHTQHAENPATADDRPLLFHLKAGDNTVTLPYVSEPILLGCITISSPENVPTYAQYRASSKFWPTTKHLETVEAEQMLHKNQPFIRVQADGNPSAVPFSSDSLRLNAMGGDSWQLSGHSVTWKFQVPADGQYQIAVKYKQIKMTSDAGTDMPVYRSMRIDGVLPFEEARRIAFPFTTGWKNNVLSDKGNSPYRLFLKAGEHTLTLTADDSPYRETIRTIKDVMKGVNELVIQLKMATGNTQDANRDWDLTDQIPDAGQRLTQYADRLEKQYGQLVGLVGRNPEVAKAMKVSSQMLRNLAKDPNSIAYKSTQLSGGSGSILQMLGKAIGRLPNQPLTIDRIYVYSDKKLPSAKSGLFSRMKANLSVFFGSFTKDYAKINDNGKDALQIWVNRPRQFVMTMQQLANEDFTKKTGIKVSFSLMPDETKLILANAAGNSPDLALSINMTTPFNLAIRGTLTDLTQFPDYDEIAKRFSPGAMLPFQFTGKTYALPETQNFWVLFYRKDILDALHIPVPDTMEDVKRILPDLQRYGLNFYDPLAQTGGNKQIWLTAPFIYQHGGDLFTKDGSKTAIDSENAIAGIKEMTDLFTVYNLPLNVPSFYNHFRDGSLPIGIADFSTYIQLISAAPEINGMWNLAPMPGVKNKDGTVERWAPGTGQSTVIFKNSKRQQDSWELLKWWTSAETQIKFGNRMQTIYGPTFKWNTANLDAFEQLTWPADHIKAIREQWKWLKDTPHIPGDYMLERQISDAWNKIVFDGVNPRRAIEDATILTNREMAKKLEEFGFMKNGKLLEPLQVPSLPQPEGR